VDEPYVIIDSTPYMESNWPTVLQPDDKSRNNAKIWAKTMSNWMYMCYLVALLLRQGSTEHDRFQGFCRAFAFSVLPGEMATPATNYISGFLALFNRLVRIVGEAHRYPSLLLSYNDETDHSKLYESKFSELSAGRKFCVTKRRSLAWVPRDTRPGDQICLLAGCAVLFVVRPVDQHYELLGDCYRQDMMCEGSVSIGQKPCSFEFR
jgi:hypothetical protein